MPIDLLEFKRLSEGVMLKLLDGTYIAPQNRSWAKFKSEYEIDGIILVRNQTKVPTVFNYDLGVGPISAEHAHAIGDKARELDGHTYMFIGRSDATTLKLEPGEILRVAAEEVIEHDSDEPKFKYFTGYVMRVLEAISEKKRPDEVLVVQRLAGLVPRRLPPIRKALPNIRLPDFVWIPGFVSIAGSTIYHAEGLTDREPNDLDLILRCEADQKTGRLFLTLDPGLRLKLDRVMELNFGGNRDIQYTASTSGPNWDFLKIYDLILRARNPLQIEEVDEPEFKELLYKQADPYMEYLEEGKSYRFGMQIHFRGRSAHLDLRFEDAEKKALIGWTVACQTSGAITESVDTMQDAKKWFNTPDAWKIDFEKGQVRQRKVRGGQIRPAQLFSARKAREPLPWLEVEGIVPPGKVGATRYEHGVFLSIDRGTIQTGTQKPYFHEYYVKGELFSGRICFRQLEHMQEIEKDDKVLPAGIPMEDWRDPYFWSFIQPIDQRPYVLSPEAVEKKWMPPDGVSALPHEIKSILPLQFRYWSEKGDKARTARDTLVEAISAGRLKPDFDKLAKAEKEYCLQWHYWKKIKVVREGPSSQHWDLRIDLGKSDLFHLVLERNPLDSVEVSGYERPEGPQHGAARARCMERGKDGPEFLKPSGDAKEGEQGFNPWNPTKDTPAWIERIDHGSVQILESSSDLLKIKFIGKLKGTWLLTREEPGSKWWIVRRVKEGPEVEKK